jgi:hypothetical protein
MREKYCSGWKNKLKKTDYKPGEQALGGHVPGHAAVHGVRESHFSPWLWKKKGVEEVKEDRIYQIQPWEAHWRGKTEGEGG